MMPSYEFYEQCAEINKAHDTPEQLKAWRAECDAELAKVTPCDTPEKRRHWLYWQLQSAWTTARAHESGYKIMSDFALIHNFHTGIGEMLSFDVGEDLLK